MPLSSYARSRTGPDGTNVVSRYKKNFAKTTPALSSQTPESRPEKRSIPDAIRHKQLAHHNLSGAITENSSHQTARRQLVKSATNETAGKGDDVPGRHEKDDSDINSRHKPV